MARPRTVNPSRQTSIQGIHTLRFDIAWNTPGIGSGVQFPNKLPTGARLLFTHVFVKEAFNAGTTNVITVGTNATDYNNVVAAGEAIETVIAATTIFTGGDVDITADTAIYAKYAQTGGAATAGQAQIVVAFVPDSDG